MDNNHKEHLKGIYSDPSDYPQIKVTGPNLYYASLLMDDYAGAVSEFTAINQYLYHHFFFEEISEYLGKLLENVSIVEMWHLEILADLIKKLGGNPIIAGSYSTYGTFWNGSFVYYGMTTCDRLKGDIDSEYRAIEEYEKHIFMINDPYIKKILKRIILDEKVHIKLFNQALLKYCGITYKQLP
ncbi:ferritin-like domain-containing protein [Haloimpatiens sp. FM7315]|uniref:ferritin-like domain-containing protein n=1 Tax=Haloimpatiens sp. FM7315 TaxID=3298609 RepID=UPI0035A3B872